MKKIMRILSKLTSLCIGLTPILALIAYFLVYYCIRNLLLEINMKISVKVLQGQEIFLDIHNNMSIEELKQKISDTLNIPAADQKLLARGRPLLNDKIISDYPQIKDGTKLNLVVKRSISENQNQDSGCNVTILREAAVKFLKKHFTETQSEKIADEFMKQFNKSLTMFSLDDMERLAQTCLLEEENQV